MKKFAIIRKDKTILVKTPRTYVVDSYKNSESDELETVRHRLDEHTRFLYNCLKVLGVSRKEAILKDYTLDTDTGEKLLCVAQHKESVSHEMKMTIFNHDW
jgi:hypothetical protein